MPGGTVENSFPKYQNTELTPHTETKMADYHGLSIEIKSNHPMANANNYSLKIGELDEMPPVESAAPNAKGKNHDKKPETYSPDTKKD